jgi:hypothetical protein
VVASSTFQMADRVLNGQLRQVLTDFYLDTRSWEEVSRRLYAQHDIRISGQTLRRWNGELGIEAPAQESA